ncbi:MAG: serine/threonine-protein kinase, partial [Candidatus Xenobia bacterium]
KVNPSVDEGLSAIVVTAMAHAPMQRYRSAEAMRQALQGWLGGAKVAAPPPASDAPTGALTMPPAANTPTGQLPPVVPAASDAPTGVLAHRSEGLNPSTFAPRPAEPETGALPQAAITRSLVLEPERPSSSTTWALALVAVVVVAVVGFLGWTMVQQQATPLAVPTPTATTSVAVASSTPKPTPLKHTNSKHSRPATKPTRPAVTHPSPEPASPQTPAAILTLAPPTSYPTGAAVPNADRAILVPGRQAGTVSLGMPVQDAQSLPQAFPWSGTQSGGVLTAIQVSDSGWHTREQLRVGSSRAEVLRSMGTPDYSNNAMLVYREGIRFDLAGETVAAIIIADGRLLMQQVRPAQIATAAPSQTAPLRPATVASPSWIPVIGQSTFDEFKSHWGNPIGNMPQTPNGYSVYAFGNGTVAQFTPSGVYAGVPPPPPAGGVPGGTGGPPGPQGGQGPPPNGGGGGIPGM